MAAMAAWSSPLPTPFAGTRSATGLPRRVMVKRWSAYNLVNRAMAAGELVRLMRGLYILHFDIAGETPHAFVVAQHVRPRLCIDPLRALLDLICLQKISAESLDGFLAGLRLESGRFVDRHRNSR